MALDGRRAGAISGLIARRLRWTIVGAIAAGLAWQGAAIAAPLLDPPRDRRRDRPRTTRRALVGVRGRRRARRGRGDRRRRAPLLRDPEPRAGGRRGARRIFRRALELDARYHDRVGAGELISRASNDAELVARAFDSIGHTIGYVLTIFGASSVLLVIDWRLALAVLAPLPLLSVGFGRYSRRYAERTKINQEAARRARPRSSRRRSPASAS